MIEIEKPFQLIIILILVAGGIIFLSSPFQTSSQGEEVQINNVSMDKQERVEQKKTKYDLAHKLENPAGFINTDNISIQNLTGKKVILLDMWTYSCINCQRTLPYINAWHEKYKDHGLVIIGNHAPEFDFEKKRSNVEKAVDRFNISYPVVLDNEFGTWNAYNNRYWPQKYLIGIDGFIRYEHIGEGSYKETERKIQKLLKERNRVLGINKTVPDGFVDPKSMDTPSRGITPEIYFNAKRNSLLGNGQKNTRGVQQFSLPQNLENDKFYLEGKWNITNEYAENLDPSTSIKLNHKAKDVFFVAGTAERLNESVEVEVTLNGEPISKDMAGKDIQYENGTSKFIVNEKRLYSILDNEKVETGVLTLKPQRSGLNAYTFTFG